MLSACGENEPVNIELNPSLSPSASLAPVESNEKVSSEAAKELTARVVVNGSVNNFTGYELDGDYFFMQADVQTALKGVNLIGAKTFSKNDADYYSLRDISANADYDFMHDDVLAAIYIWTYPEVKQSESGNDEIDRAVSLAIGVVKADNPVITYAEFFTMLDRVVELVDASKLSAWKAAFPQARASVDSMTRYEGMKAILKCAVAMGGDYLSFNVDWVTMNNRIGEKVWNEIDKIKAPDRYIPNDYPYQGGGFPREDFSEWDDCGVAYRYSFGRVSLASSQPIFDYDESENSMLPDMPFTYSAAVLAAIRLFESMSLPSDHIPLTDPRAVTYDASIITEELLERANTRQQGFQNNMPKMNGLVFGGEYESTGFPASDAEMRNVANWGFESARIMLTFQTLFDMDVKIVDERKLKQLDRLVASAMKYNVHMNLVLNSAYSGGLEQAIR